MSTTTVKKREYTYYAKMCIVQLLFHIKIVYFHRTVAQINVCEVDKMNYTFMFTAQ